MQTDYFAPCWHRWERAKEHQTTLVDIWNGYIDEHPFDFSLVHEGDGVHVLQVWQVAPMPAEFAVVIGEWLYNLRSSLDYVIWATAVHTSGEVPPPNEQRLQFPIYDSEQAWRANLSRLDPLGERHIAMLRSMQPFASDPDANYLGWINRLARIDRHRRLVDGTAYVAELEPVVQVPEGCSVFMEWGERVLSRGRADVARLTVSPWGEDLSVKVNPRIGIDPEVGQWSASPFWGPLRFSDRLQMIQVFLAGEIAAYEYDCTGRSRKCEMLTDTFRDEADARSKRAIVPPMRPPVTWKAAGPGRPSTADQLAGRDFPTGSQLPTPDR